MNARHAATLSVVGVVLLLMAAIVLVTSRRRQEGSGEGHTMVGSSIVAHFNPRAHDEVFELLTQHRRTGDMPRGSSR